MCQRIGLELDKNIYATNYFKNFFVKPPTQLNDDDVFSKFSPLWLPLLREELAHFDNAPIITLGQPVLSIIVQKDASKLVREYWGYDSDWKSGKTLPFKYILAADNALNRVVFPFSHQQTFTKPFYRSRIEKYVEFVQHSIITLRIGIS